ncbi:VOC family protein [Salegentibacter sp. F188]|uniref:VOC family protein n=1 Tax=Autumnicola patrickiae TaxID=3075591 RepID=A0ABU3DZI3_9FLAO|nr:VOC family protein [Salegentibacter sp. F188]MDT0689153.1 VOC family protein [Salegentibacter sp. F188]
MATINVYLQFNGNCERAFDFYKSVFGGEYQFKGRYKELSETARQNIPHATDEQIMHIALPISKETILMGADVVDPEKDSTHSHSGFSLFVNADDKKEADRLFAALSDEGKVIVSITDQFWGSYYGLCTDKFGISWKISFTNEN